MLYDFSSSYSALIIHSRSDLLYKILHIFDHERCWFLLVFYPVYFILGLGSRTYRDITAHTRSARRRQSASRHLPVPSTPRPMGVVVLEDVSDSLLALEGESRTAAEHDWDF